MLNRGRYTIMNIEQQLHQALLEIERLKQENAHLRQLLKQNTIASGTFEHAKQPIMNQQTKDRKIQQRIQIFKSLFRGRDDVYAVRWESRNGKSGYTPACALEWQRPLCQKPNIKCSQCQCRQLLSLRDATIYQHLSGEITIGLYPLLKDDSCWFLAADFDNKDWKQDIQAFVTSCKELGVSVSVERSRSGNGGHAWIFFNEPVSAKLARQLGHFILSQTLSKRYEVGMDSYDRLFPNQDTLPKGGFGNLIALPLQRVPRKQGNSVFVDEYFIPYEDQWRYLEQIKKLNVSEIKRIVQTSYKQEQVLHVKEATSNEIEKLPSVVTVIERNGLHLKKNELPSQLVHEMIKLSSFNNPEFFKAQSKRLSTHGIPRTISCYEETKV